jgi:hypothetical protein
MLATPSMRFGRLSGHLLLATMTLYGAAPQDLASPPPTAEEQRLILARVSRESLRYQRELPDLICTQLTNRSVDDSGTGKHWKGRDRLEVEDDYVGRFVNHKLLMMNGSTPRKNYQQLDGLLSETVLHSLGFLPRWIFGPQAKTSFEWQKWSMIDGKPMHVFAVRVPVSESELTVSSDRQSTISGIEGLIYVDAATSLVQRFEIHLDVPAGSVLQDGFVRIDYGSVTISERQYLLPIKAQVQARVRGSLERNETEVVRYQRYATETTLHFDEPAEN